MENNSLLYQIVLQFRDRFDPFSEDISALLLSPDGHLWLGSDETASLERLSSIDSRTFGNHEHFQVGDFIDLPSDPEEEIDIEGLAYSDYYLWLVGSHSRKRKKPKPDKTDQKNLQRLAKVESEANRYILARIPLVNGQLLRDCPHPNCPDNRLTAAKLQLTEKGNVLTDALESDPHIGPFIRAGIPSKDNGLDIEGLAVCNGKIFVGLRGPVLRGWAILLELELVSISPDILNLKKVGEEGEVYKKHVINLGGLGIRDLCIDGEDLLILAGPTMDLDGPAKLFRLKNGINRSDKAPAWEPETAIALPYGEGNHHPEGVTLWTAIAGRPSVLVVYDSPAQTHAFAESASVLADVFGLG